MDCQPSDMRFCPTCGCETTDHTPINIVKEWRDKAKKWDNRSQLDKFDAEIIEKAKKWDEFQHGHDTINTWREKAEKWDEWGVNGISTYKIEEVEALREKAQKWDSHQYLHETTDGSMITHISKNELEELEEKAKKYDEFVAVDRSLVELDSDEYDKLKEKAKKYDEYTMMRKPFQYWNEVEKKAKMWDSFAGLKSYEETVDKAKKWDKIKDLTLFELFKSMSEHE